MASSKRGASASHYGDRNQHLNKRHKPERPVYNSATYVDGRNGHGRPQQRSNIAPQPPALSPREMQTGMVALLDRFVADETTPEADRDILHHARELRRLLCLRNDSTSSNAKRELDQKRPDKADPVVMPEYIDRKVRAAKDLPFLPPITEPHLHEAVFTHRTALNPGDPSAVRGIQELDYDRLELLGDAYLELIATRALYNRFPHVDVPDLATWRERLVENSALSKFSEAYGFPDRLKHRAFWDKSSKAWAKVIADIFEAYVAALILSDPENGFTMAEEWLTELWAPQLLGFKAKIVENPHARNELQRKVLAKNVKLDYREEKPMTYTTGVQTYFIGIYLTGWGYEDEWLGSGEGRNKAQAGVAAAEDAWKRSSPALNDAVRQKAELLEAKKLEKEKGKEAEAKEEGDQSTIAEEEMPNKKDRVTEDVTEKRRKSGVEETSSEKKKKHKKSKEEKEKKRKASTDDDSF